MPAHAPIASHPPAASQVRCWAVWALLGAVCAVPAGAPAGSIQGWIARNATLAVKEGALVLTPAANSAGGRPFLAHAQLNLVGPVIATLRLRARTFGASTIIWRTKQASFEPTQSAAFDWPSGADWREVKVTLPEKGPILQVRITPAQDAEGIEIESLQLRDSRGQARDFDFRAAK